MKVFKWQTLVFALGCLPFLAIAGQARAGDSAAANAAATKQHTNIEPILPVPRQIDVDSRKLSLGKRLFEDKRLSGDGSKACVSCHYLDKGGTDLEKLSPAIDGGYRTRNTPSIYNVGLLLLLGWEGHRKDLGDLTEAIIKSKQGLASDWPQIIPRLKSQEAYRRAFTEIYPDGIAPKNVKDAIAEYMRSLVTPDSRFDHYLRGDEQALTTAEKDGYQLFKSYGCASCHQGVALGGNMNAPIGLFTNSAAKTNQELYKDPGRFKTTKKEDDKHVFRVSSLRNVALTAPYMHTGTVQTLDEAVDVMGRYMLGRAIPEDHRGLIVAFLKTLTGEYQGKPL